MGMSVVPLSKIDEALSWSVAALLVMELVISVRAVTANRHVHTSFHQHYDLLGGLSLSSTITS